MWLKKESVSLTVNQQKVSKLKKKRKRDRNRKNGGNNNYNEIEYPKMWDDYKRWNTRRREKKKKGREEKYLKPS